ncbi:MAG: hypothetical protein JWQ49_3767 [Edaphobacter sp.]|nr:hypothetical protein [Edaphobacter sp.]
MRIIMFNSRNLGALIVDEKPHVKSWDEPQYSIHNLGIEESYGFGVAQRRSGNRRRQERQGPPERDVDAKGVDHLDRIDSPVFEPPSGLLGSAPFDVNNDNYDLNSVSFVS